MSNDNIEQEQINATPEQVEQNQEIDVKALMAQMEEMQGKMQQLSGTNERLLNESKTHKTKYQTLKNEVETKKKATLEEGENWKELLDIEKNRAFELEENNRKIKQSVLKERLNFEVARLATDAYDVTDVINSLPKDLLSIDDENLKIEGIEEGISAVRTRKPHLFNTGPKPHGMGQERPEGYKEEKQELSLEAALAQGFEKKVI